MTRSRVVVTGAGGMAGSVILRTLIAKGHEAVGFSGRETPSDLGSSQWKKIDVLDYPELRKALFDFKPTVIVHAASSVFVNECEKPSERAAIHDLHVTFTEVLTRVARELGSQVIYISTESVYDGKKLGRYLESDPTHPLNYYALTKLQGEESVRNWDRGVVFRTNILGWRTDANSSFMQWVLTGLQNRERRTMLTDVTFTPISTQQLADDILGAIELRLAGLYHAGGADSVSKHELAIELAKQAQLDTSVLVPVTMDEIAMGAPRPRNTSLDSARLATALGKARPSIQESVRRFLVKR